LRDPPPRGWRRVGRALGLLLLAVGSAIVYVLAYQLITATVSADTRVRPQQTELRVGEVPGRGPGGNAPAKAMAALPTTPVRGS
jgi:hypothetical protein